MKSSTALSLDLAPAASTRPGLSVTALDLSLAHTGFATSDGRVGVLEPPKGCIGMPRLKWVLDSAWNLAEHADLVVLEGYAFARPQFAHQLGELGGIVRFTLWEAGVRYVDIQPKSMKMFATDNGNAGKSDVLVAAVKKLSYDGADDNEADALWLLEMARAHYGTRTNAARLTAKQTQSLSKIQWPALTPVNSAARRDISHTEE